MSKSTATIKFTGGILTALVIFTLGSMAARTFYTTSAEMQEGEAPVRGFVVVAEEGAEDDGAPAEEVVQLTLAERLAAADVANGEKLFKKCAACHKLEEGKNGVGPYLYGVYGRDIASDATGFSYSDALIAIEGNWTAEALDAWLENPKAFAPGNKMSYKGLPKETDRADMIAYLATIGGDGLDLDNLDGAAAPAETPAPMQEPATETAEAPAAEMAPAAETAPATTAEAPAAEMAPAAETAPATTAEAPAAEMAPAAETAPATTAEAPAAEMAPAAETAPAAEAVAMAGDPEAGEKVFKKCAACHALEEGKNKVGPSLFGVVGREVASTDFKYSDPMHALGGVWTPERLAEYLTKPKDMVPGTKMSFAGLRKEEDRANIIAYLATIK